MSRRKALTVGLRGFNNHDRSGCIKQASQPGNLGFSLVLQWLLRLTPLAFPPSPHLASRTRHSQPTCGFVLSCPA